MGRDRRRSAKHLSDRDGISLLSHEAPFASRRLRLRRRSPESLGSASVWRKRFWQGGMDVSFSGLPAYPPRPSERLRADVEPVDIRQWRLRFPLRSRCFSLLRPECASLSFRVLLVFGRRLASARRALAPGAFYLRSGPGDV